MKAPSNWKSSSSAAVRAFYLKMNRLVYLVMDEESMTGRPNFAWIRHRTEEMRRMVSLPSSDQSNDDDDGAAASGSFLHSVHPPIPRAVTDRHFGGIPIVETYGDCHQIPPVGMKLVMDMAPATSPDSACASGRIAFHEFLHPLPETGVRSLVVIMTEVVRQRGDPRFRDIIQHMREGTVTREDADLLMARRLSALSPEERADFVQNALFVMPTWRRTVPITRQYLIDLGQPVARVDTVYEHPPPTKPSQPCSR
jgi:hypothetical protein